MQSLRFAFLFAFCALLTACSGLHMPGADSAKIGPFYTPTNTTNRGPLPISMRRVLVLPASGTAQMTEETLRSIDEQVNAELTHTAKFETVSMTRDDLKQMFGQFSFSSVAELPMGFFEKLAKTYGVDAVLFTDITTYSPYPPLSIGVRQKLARASDRVIWWAADNVFSASDASVANSARRTALKLGADRGPGDLSHTILQNPTRFAAFAFSETFATLPSR